jgi:hypothetical protein
MGDWFQVHEYSGGGWMVQGVRVGRREADSLVPPLSVYEPRTSEIYSKVK